MGCQVRCNAVAWSDGGGTAQAAITCVCTRGGPPSLALGVCQRGPHGVNQAACVSDGNQVQVGRSVLAVQGVQCKV